MNQDDIRIAHTPYNRSELQASAASPASEQATTLPEEAEATFRRFLFDLFDLSPIELLILQHFRNGGTPVTFRAHFLKHLKESIKYGERDRTQEWYRVCDEIGAKIERATVAAIWNGVKKKMPMLAALQSWEEGHGGRQAQETDAEKRDESKRSSTSSPC